MTLEIRTAVGGELKDIDEVKRQVLCTFPHNVRDSYNTSFHRDAFDASFRARKPIAIWQHDLSQPIGHTTSAQVTDSANELVLQLDPFDAVPLAHRAFVQMQSGTLRDMSFGFTRHEDRKHSDPEMRGVTEILRATMSEVSPVSLGAIPGAGVTALRSEPDATLHPPTIAEIEHLFQANLLDREEARALLADLPEYRMRIVLGGTASTPVVEIATEAPTAPEPDAEVVVEEGRATMTLSDGDATPASGDGYDDDGDVADLAAAVDAALDSAAEWIAKVDTSSLPDELKQALALVAAAGAVADELLDALGVPDVDEPGDDAGRSVEAPEVASDAEVPAEEAREVVPGEVEERALALSTKPWDPKQGDYTPQQWKAACLIWNGDPEDKSAGSLPVREPDGTVNKAALSAAAGRLSQVDAPDDVKKAAAKALMGLYSKAGLKFPPSLLSAARTIDDDPETRAIVADAVDSELDDLFGRLGVEAA